MPTKVARGNAARAPERGPGADREAYEAFGYVMEVPHFSTVDKWSNQLVGAFAMWMAQGKIKKKYAIDDERAAQHWYRRGVKSFLALGAKRVHICKDPFAGDLLCDPVRACNSVAECSLCMRNVLGSNPNSSIPATHAYSFTRLFFLCLRF